MLIVGVALQQVRFDHLCPHVLAKLHCSVNAKNFLNFSDGFSSSDRYFKMSPLYCQITVTCAPTHRLQIFHRELQLHREVPRIGWRIHLRKFVICRDPSRCVKPRGGSSIDCPLKCVKARRQRTRWVLQLSVQSMWAVPSGVTTR